MITLKHLASNKFFIAMAKDLEALGKHSGDFKYLTVKNVNNLSRAQDISDAVDIIKTYLERCENWRTGSEMAADTIFDLGQNLSNITNDADQPCSLEDGKIDVREMLDVDSYNKSLETMINIICICELYPQSSVYSYLLMNTIAVLSMMYKTIRVALKFFGEPIASSHEFNNFLGQYGISDIVSSAEHNEEVDYGLAFTKHDKQVVFNDEETRAIEEAERVAAEEEKKIQETCTEIKKTNDLQKLLTSIVGDKIGTCQTIDDCKRVTALANILKAVYAWNINMGMVDEKSMLEGGWELLNDILQHPDKESVYFFIHKITPYSIAYWLDKLFDKKLEAMFMTSMETITLDPNAMYHYDEESKVTIHAV